MTKKKRGLVLDSILFDSLKIAFVKSKESPVFKITQFSNDDSLRKVMQSSPVYTHTIFLGLFKHFNTDIITLSDNTWQKRVHFEAVYMGGSDTRRRYMKKLKEPVDKIVSSKKVEWDEYDIVISLDAAVPKSTLKKYSKPLWLTMVHVPGYSFYVFNYITPFFGYAISLLDNLPNRNTLTEDEKQVYRKVGKLKIAFTLAFMKSGDLFNLSKNASLKVAKEGIHLEPHSGSLISEEELSLIKKKFTSKEKPFSVSYLVPKEEYINVISARKYFVVAKKGMRILRGNALVEANSANCLILIQKGVSVIHNKIVMGSMIFDGFNDLLKKISFYEKNDDEYKKDLIKQQLLVDRYCFEYPKSLLIDLLKLHRECEKTGMGKVSLKFKLFDTFFSLSYPLVWIVLIPIYRLIYNISAKVFKKDLVSVLSRLLN